MGVRCIRTEGNHPAVQGTRVALTGVWCSAACFEKDANKPNKMQKTAITTKWFRKMQTVRRG